MFDDSRAFITRAFLRAEFELEYRAYCEEGRDETLLERLNAWDGRTALSEVQAEGAFIQTFFVETWGYGQAGQAAPEDQTLVPKLRIAGEGAGGGMGEADAALGWFRGNLDATPQVLCEFKDINSKLDAKQNRKGSTRSPVQQALNYVRGARRGLFGNEPVQPWWAFVSDMNEFRLYWWDRAPSEYLRFVIRRDEGDLLSDPYDLRTQSEAARFDRFLFQKLFSRDMLLSPAGRPPLLRLIERQWTRERKLEGEFYDRYKAVRERLFNVMRLDNPDFPGTPTELLRLSQVLLDRFIFAFYCEDMGQRMLFPPQLIRDFLKSRSAEPFYDPNGSELWDFLKRLFSAMNEGGKLGGMDVPQINGGLFAHDPQIEALILPNHVFAAAGQGKGTGTANLQRDPDTLLYLSATYNFAASGDAKESLSLYTLGRIFEQSITELEYRVGELEGRETVAKLSKRKRDGVYYTPEWAVNLLVEETMGPWFAAAKAECGYPAEEDGAPDRRSAERYVERLQAIRVVDPACGSGAFLIAAFRRLLEERRTASRDLGRASGGSIKATATEEATLIAEILAGNIYGVDINPASVEITKLALWLHSARPEHPLSSLDHTIRCGNSLVGHDFWTMREADAARRETVNSFDWREAFPEIWPAGTEGGFDIVLGNPPYVKLQNLMKVDPAVVAYLRANRGEDTYQSAQTGNPDLYLPFIEKGLRLLAPGGRMAYIAPSLWTVNDYGEGLRKLVHRRRQLDRWIDFKAHQVFDEAITYTALQFFTREGGGAVRIVTAPEGETEARDADWDDAALRVPWDTMAEDGEWLMATGAERALINRLAETCLRLDDPSLTSGITVGIQTSADSIYHLERLGDDRYLCSPKKGEAYEVTIEDAIMKPLVSGAEAKRYEEPETDTYLLFPYARAAGGRMRLIPAETMAADFPQAWAYLTSWEKTLRAREKGKMDGPTWWAYNYPKNLDKQDRAKLMVPRLVEHLKSCVDTRGLFYLDNVDVGGVLTAEGTDPAFLMGVLNGPLADFIFRIIAKPFRGDYRSANKQFIAPLPVPRASAKEQADIAARARDLQTRWTNRRDLLEAAKARLGVLPRARHDETWLWPDLPALADLTDKAPRAMRTKGDKLDWAKQSFEERVAARIEALQAVLDGGGPLDADFADGELRLFSGGTVVLSRIFLSGKAGAIALAYWRWLFLSRDWRVAEGLSKELRRPPSDFAAPAAQQFVERVEALADETAAIEAAEDAMNERLGALYGLSDEERLLVDNEKAGRR